MENQNNVDRAAPPTVNKATDSITPHEQQQQQQQQQSQEDEEDKESVSPAESQPSSPEVVHPYKKLRRFLQMRKASNETTPFYLPKKLQHRERLRESSVSPPSSSEEWTREEVTQEVPLRTYCGYA